VREPVHPSAVSCATDPSDLIPPLEKATELKVYFGPRSNVAEAGGLSNAAGDGREDARRSNRHATSSHLPA